MTIKNYKGVLSIYTTGSLGYGRYGTWSQYSSGLEGTGSKYRHSPYSEPKRQDPAGLFNEPKDHGPLVRTAVGAMQHEYHEGPYVQFESGLYGSHHRALSEDPWESEGSLVARAGPSVERLPWGQLCKNNMKKDLRYTIREPDLKLERGKYHDAP